MYIHPTLKKTLISLLILVTFLAVQNINTPITNKIVRGVDRALNFQYNYSALWQSVSPLAAAILQKDNWVALQEMAKIRLKARENEGKNFNIFSDLEEQ